MRSERAGRWVWLAFGILLVAWLPASGCAKARAETMAPDGPPLAMPAPPPRVLAPVEELAAAPEIPAASAPVPVATAPRPPVPTRVPTPAPAPAPAPPPPTPAEPPREVRTPALNPGEDRKVRDILRRASNDLNRVDYRRLSIEGREQYDQSKRFANQADQALKDRNYVFAQTLADKAATMAAELLGR